MVHDGAVTVIFVDGADGKEVGRSKLPPDQLPETFDTDTTVDIRGTTWLVERAEPEGAARWRASRTLTLVLRRATVVPARDILFSLPSICGVLPSVAGTRSGGDAFEIHQDDWRQVEMIAGSLRGVIQSEVGAIRAIYDERARRASDGGIIGFSDIHVRSQPVRPLPEPPSLRRVLSMLPQPSRQYAGVAFAGTAGIAVGSFAAAFGGVNLYGLADGDAIEVLCLDGRAVPGAGSPDLIPQPSGSHGGLRPRHRRLVSVLSYRARLGRRVSELTMTAPGPRALHPGSSPRRPRLGLPTAAHVRL